MLVETRNVVTETFLNVARNVALASKRSDAKHFSLLHACTNTKGGANVTRALFTLSMS